MAEVLLFEPHHAARRLRRIHSTSSVSNPKDLAPDLTI